MSIINYKGQSLQDKFVSKVLKEKRDGFFIEIGSGNPIKNNNTYTKEHAQLANLLDTMSI